MATLASVTTEKPIIFVRFHPETKQAVDEAADKDGRSISSFLEKITVEWLRANGWPDIRLYGPKRRPKRRKPPPKPKEPEKPR